MLSSRDNAPMLNRFFILLLIGLSLLTLHPVHAQTPPSTAVLDALPPCGYTAAAPDGNILVGAVVYNLQTGTGCAENLDTLFPVASVPKVFVAAAFFQMVLETDGLINFQTPITFSDRYWMSGRNSCGCARPQRSGGRWQTQRHDDRLRRQRRHLFGVLDRLAQKRQDRVFLDDFHTADAANPHPLCQHG